MKFEQQDVGLLKAVKFTVSLSPFLFLLFLLLLFFFFLLVFFSFFCLLLFVVFLRTFNTSSPKK